LRAFVLLEVMRYIAIYRYKEQDACQPRGSWVW